MVLQDNISLVLGIASCRIGVPDAGLSTYLETVRPSLRQGLLEPRGWQTLTCQGSRTTILFANGRSRRGIGSATAQKMIRGFDTGYTMEDKNNVLATMRSRWVTLAPHIREKRPHGQIMSRNGAGVHDVDSILYHFIQFGSHASRSPPKC